MQVHHHGTLAAQARRPDVQLEHVLALPAIVPIKKKSLLSGRPWMQVLRTIGAVGKRRKFVSPRRGRLSRKPSVLASRGLAVGNALEGENAPIEESAHFAILRLCNRRTRSGAVPGLLVRGCLNAVRSECRLGGREACACRRRKNQRLPAREKTRIFGACHEVPFLRQLRDVKNHARRERATINSP